MKFTKDELKDTLDVLFDWKEENIPLTDDDRSTIYEQFLYLVKQNITKNIISSQKIGIVGDGAVVTGLHLGDL
jgi:hypothetical protein